MTDLRAHSSPTRICFVALHPSPLVAAGRSLMGLPAGWRGAEHTRAIGRRDGKCPLKMPAVRRHPLWTAAHVDAPVTDIIQSICAFYILMLSL